MTSSYGVGWSRADSKQPFSLLCMMKVYLPRRTQMNTTIGASKQADRHVMESRQSGRQGKPAVHKKKKNMAIKLN